MVLVERGKPRESSRTDTSPLLTVSLQVLESIVSQW